MATAETYTIHNDSSEKIKLSLFFMCDHYLRMMGASHFSPQMANVQPEILDPSQSGELQIDWQALGGSDARKIANRYLCPPDTLTVVLNVKYPSDSPPAICVWAIDNLKEPDLLFRGDIGNDIDSVQHYYRYIWRNHKKIVYCNLNDHVIRIKNTHD
jgi:hypothetical protein